MLLLLKRDTPENVILRVAGGAVIKRTKSIKSMYRYLKKSKLTTVPSITVVQLVCNQVKLTLNETIIDEFLQRNARSGLSINNN